jgi:hypothetical protein
MAEDRVLAWGIGAELTSTGAERRAGRVERQRHQKESSCGLAPFARRNTPWQVTDWNRRATMRSPLGPLILRSDFSMAGTKWRQTRMAGGVGAGG